jgi:hypothetical protein
MHDVTPEQWARIDALFDVALDCPPEERRDFLEEACDNPDLRAIVLELLAHTEADTAFLDVPVSRRNDALWDDFAEHLFDASDAPASSDQDRIGPYRLIERVGTGGSGVVYRADRADGASTTPLPSSFLPVGPTLGPSWSASSTSSRSSPISPTPTSLSFTMGASPRRTSRTS